MSVAKVVGEPLLTRRQRFKLALPVLVLAFVLSMVGVAWAAFHVQQDFSHGLGDYDGRFFESRFYASISDQDGTYPNASLAAGMYHLAAGGWNQQCYEQDAPRYSILCFGYSGREPCYKYAWTRGTDPTSRLEWHGMRSAAPVCN